jgi:isoleucyl-tRNA synthetase
MKIALPAGIRGDALDELLPMLSAEVNVREITIVESDESLVALKAKPNFRTLGKVYGKDTPLAAKAADMLTPSQLQELEAGKTQRVESDGKVFEYGPDDVVVQREVKTDWLVQNQGAYVAALDPTVTPELKSEGTAREVVNRVQRLRKEAGYDYDTRVELSLSGDSEVLRAVDAFRVYISGETLARRIELEKDLSDSDVSEEVDLDGKKIVVSLKRHGDSREL